MFYFTTKQLYEMRSYKSYTFTFKLLKAVVEKNITMQNLYTTGSLFQQVKPKRNIYFFTTIAFMWPVKKLNKEINGKKPPSILQNADILFETGNYDECCKLLSSYEDQDVETQWRLCRALYHMSKDKALDKSCQKNLIIKAFEIISNELDNNNDHFAVHKWYAILLDAKSSHDGIKERIRQLENIKKHMDLAATINPNDATTLFMLGEWCYLLAELPWHQRKIAETLFASPPQSTYEDALEYFLQAETIQPRFYCLNLLRLGCCYLKLKKEDQAKYYLKLAASYPAKSNDEHQATREAAELLKKMRNQK